MKSAVTTSSNETAKAKIAPVTTPGRIRGRVTRRKVTNGSAPRLSAARIKLASNRESVADTVTTTNGVSIIGTANLPSSAPVHASEMYARNLYNFLELMLKDGALNLDWDDELIAKTCLTHAGEIRHEPTRALVAGG